MSGKLTKILLEDKKGDTLNFYQDISPLSEIKSIKVEQVSYSEEKPEIKKALTAYELLLSVVEHLEWYYENKDNTPDSHREKVSGLIAKLKRLL